MAEIETIEIINNPEIIDRRKIKKVKKVKEDTPTVEKNNKIKILKAPWRNEILEDGTKNIIINPVIPNILKNIIMRNEKKKNQL